MLIVSTAQELKVIRLVAPSKGEWDDMVDMQVPPGAAPLPIGTGESALSSVTPVDLVFNGLRDKTGGF